MKRQILAKALLATTLALGALSAIGYSGYLLLVFLLTTFGFDALFFGGLGITLFIFVTVGFYQEFERDSLRMSGKR